MEELKKFLKKCGHDIKVIDQLIGFEELSDDDKQKVDIDLFSDSFKSGQREVFKNDPDFINELKGEARGKERGSVERAIRRVLGITAEEVREKELEGNYDKLLNFGKEKVEKSGTGTAQELQNELHDVKEKIKNYEENVIPNLKEEGKSEVNKFHIKNRIHELISESGELAVNQKVATTIVNEHLNNNYQITYDNGEIVIKTRDGLIPQDKDKTRNLTNLELIKGKLETEGLLKQSQGSDLSPPPPSPLPSAGGEMKFRPQGMDAAEESVNQKIRVKKEGEI